MANKHQYEVRVGKKSTTYLFKSGDVNKIVITPYADGTVRLKIYDGTSGNKNDLLIQAVMCQQAALEFSESVHVIASGNN